MDKLLDDAWMVMNHARKALRAKPLTQEYRDRVIKELENVMQQIVASPIEDLNTLKSMKGRGKE